MKENEQMEYAVGMIPGRLSESREVFNYPHLGSLFTQQIILQTQAFLFFLSPEPRNSNSLCLQKVRQLF
ncbi:hypothetical protein GQ457_14G012370 [Hibiscus cannabinus]